MRFLPVLFLTFFWSVLPARAQYTTTAFDSEAESRLVELGPIPGLTTRWHPAPLATGAPLGAVLQFRVSVPPGAEVTWSGASEVDRRQYRSTAELRLDSLAPRTVTVTFSSPEGDPRTETFQFEPVPFAPAALTASRPRLTVEPLVIDPESPNLSSMALYFQGHSIAALNELESGSYRTSTNRWLTLESDIQPSALAPLVEWRLDGKVLPRLGSRIRVQLFTTGQHSISAAGSEPAKLETYRVRLTSPRAGEPIPSGRPVTFTAATEPPGFESEITWLASTKYGHCDPILGRGPEFTTTFSDTLGESGSWLGVRADDAILGLDSKADDCAEFQRTAGRALEILPALPEEPSAYRDFLTRTRELAEDTVSGAVCAEGRQNEVAAELSGLNSGLTGGVSVAGLVADIFEPCIRTCKDVLACQACDWGVACFGPCYPTTPDLQVTFEDGPGTPTLTPCGNPVLQNVGGRTGPFKISIRIFVFGDDEPQEQELSLSGLNPGQSIVLGVLPPADCSFGCRLEIIADGEGQTADNNRSNNRIECEFSTG